MQGDDDDDVSFDDVTEVLPKNRQDELISKAIQPAAPAISTAAPPLDDSADDVWDDHTATLTPEVQARLVASAASAALPFGRATPAPLIAEDESPEQWADVTEQLSPADQAQLRTAPTLPFQVGPVMPLPAAATPPPTALDPQIDDDDFSDRTEYLSSTEHLLAAKSEVLPFEPASFVGASITPAASFAAATITADHVPAPKASQFFHRVTAPAAPNQALPPPSTPILPRQTTAITLVHDSDLSVMTFPWMFQGQRYLRTIIAKMTCDLVPGDIARIRADAEFPTGDVYRDDDRSQSLLYASDFVPQKPKVDVTLVGHASISGPAVESAVVEFRFGDPAQGGFDRKLQVHGPRRFERAADGTVFPGKPSAWTRTPLVYELAFGGPTSPDNPVGIGKDGVFAPRLEYLHRPVRTPNSTIGPACFAPVASSWPVRSSHIGTFDDSWASKRWPSMPVDHDWAYWQSAPAEQQLAQVRGDEPFVLTGLHATHGVIDGHLPGRKARCFAERMGQLYEVPMRLDTVAFDSTQLKVDLVFRGSMEVVDEDASDVHAVFVTMEPVQGPSLLPDEIDARYRAKKELLAASSPVPLTKPANDRATDSFAPRHALVHAALVAGGAATLGALPEAAAHETPAQPEIPPPQADPAARRRVEKLLAEGQPLTGLDLENADLSGMDLSRQTMSRTNLRRANLRGANLEDADLSDVQAADAVFTKVRAARIKLDGADLTACNLDEADLTEASLARTNLTNAHATAATFRSVRGDETQFESAALGFAVFEHAELPKADFSSAVLDNASFAHARMPDVRLYEAAGHAIKFDEAVLTGARADGGKFERASFVAVDAAGSIWDNAKLNEATFSKANLAHASFERAELNRAVFTSAQLTHATLRKARLVGAVLEKANLMQATLDSADLTDAVLRDANLYGAETWRAKIERTDLSRALLQKSKLEGERK